MARLSAKLRSVEGGRVAFWCPGCGESHVLRVDGSESPRWTWDGNADAPTFSPSVLVTYQHPEGYDNNNPAPKGYDGEYADEVCHSFVRGGRIEFLGDCTHSLKGQTVDLPDFPGN